MKIINNNLQYSKKLNNISFRGVNENIQIGKQVLKELRKEIKFPASNTYLNAKMQQHQFKSNSRNFMPKLHSMEKAVYTDIKKMYKKLKENLANGSYKNFNEYATAIKKETIKNKACNCEYQARIVQNELLKKGQEPHRIMMEVVPTSRQRGLFKSRNHMFTIIGLSPNYNLLQPKTWGKDAVVVDSWGNKVLKTADALKWMQKFFQVNSKNECMMFSNIDDYLYKEELSKRKLDKLNPFKIIENFFKLGKSK